jgi:hypothetical protein
MWLGKLELARGAFASQCTLTWLTDKLVPRARTLNICVMNGYTSALLLHVGKMDTQRCNRATWQIGPETRKVLLPVLWRQHWALLVWTRGRTSIEKSAVKYFDSKPGIFKRRSFGTERDDLIQTTSGWIDAFVKLLEPLVCDVNDSGRRFVSTTDTSGVVQEEADCFVFVWNRMIHEIIGASAIHRFMRKEVLQGKKEFDPWTSATLNPGKHPELYR